MYDHTFNGLPVSKMETTDILECLTEGVEIREWSCGKMTLTEARQAVHNRLRIEILIRAHNLRAQV